MGGALILAAGTEKAFAGDLTLLVIGYVIIRSSGIWLWWKVSRDNPHLKTTGMRYAVGILLCQIAWITQGFFELSYLVFLVIWAAEFLVPIYAESHTQTHYHSEHIEERYGLLTIIVLGESILASTYSFKTLGEHFSFDVLMVSIGCILTLFGCWWLYFNSSVEHRLREKKIAFQWGYGHYVLFGAAAAIGAMVSVNIDVLTDHADISLTLANLGFSISVAAYLAGVWFCQERLLSKDLLQANLMLAIAALVILLGFLPQTVLTVGVLITASVIYRQYRPLNAGGH